MKTVELLETTLRDGSYAIDFKFTVKDTANIASALEQAGLNLIEIGHGLGLHGKEAGKGDAAATDAEYLAAAAGALKKARFGMFCIPGIARLEDLDMAAGFGMHFVRIGTNATEIKEAEPFFARAKKHGMTAFSNLMKTYSVTPAEFGECAKQARAYGADVVVVVDSAGGMLPDEVGRYVTAAREACDIAVGYHGHNNLGLANSNTLAAAECGASIVDTSLKGLGRSAGNAITEMMVMILKKTGYAVPVDEFLLMDIAEKFINPMLHGIKNTPISITGGYAQFHSSYLGTVLRFADKYHVDPRELIVRVTRKDKVNAPDALVEELASEIQRERTVSSSLSLPVLKEVPDGPRTDAERNRLLIDNLINESRKKGKATVFNIVLSDTDKNVSRVSDFLQESPLYITASAELSDARLLASLLPVLDGTVDYVLLDNSIKRDTDLTVLQAVTAGLKKNRLLRYSDLSVWIRSVVSLLSYRLDGLSGKTLVLHGASRLADGLSRHAAELGAVVRAADTVRDNDSCDALISCSCEKRLTADFIARFRHIGCVMDAKILSVEEACIRLLHEREILLIRPDMRPALAGEILHQAGSSRLVTEDLGRTVTFGEPVVAGGVVGRKGDIVVDSISRPTRVIGIAKGDGEVLYRFSAEEQQRLDTFQGRLDSSL